MNRIFIFLSGSGWILSSVQNIFPKFGILKPEVLFCMPQHLHWNRKQFTVTNMVRYIGVPRQVDLSLRGLTPSVTCCIPSSSERSAGRIWREPQPWFLGSVTCFLKWILLKWIRNPSYFWTFQNTALPSSPFEVNSRAPPCLAPPC